LRERKYAAAGMTSAASCNKSGRSVR